jgi:hypothetical protein
VNLLLYEDLPLRTSAALGDYTEDAILPVVYGDLSQSAVPLVKLSETEYLAADHPATVTAVYVNEQETKGWDFCTQTDITGQSYCKVTLAAPPEKGATITASMRGKRNAITGALIEHPADILQDLLALAGKTWDLSRLKMELPGVRIAGRLDKAQSVRSWMDEIAKSCGVVWAERFAAAYPYSTGVHVTELNVKNCQISSISASIQDAADRLQIAFDYHAAKGAFAQYMELSAKSSPFGMSGAPMAKLEAPWLRQPADALALGKRLLTRLAGQRAAITLDTGTVLNVGDWFGISHPSLPVSGTLSMMALSLETSPGKPDRRIGGEIYWGEAPTITLDHHARAIRPKAEGGVDVAFKNGIATFTILGPDGKPLPNALVAMDNGAPKKTNAQGKVSFEANSGAHTIAVEADGYVPFTFEVTL